MGETYGSEIGENGYAVEDGDPSDEMIDDWMAGEDVEMLHNCIDALDNFAQRCLAAAREHNVPEAHALFDEYQRRFARPDDDDE